MKILVRAECLNDSSAFSDAQPRKRLRVICCGTCWRTSIKSADAPYRKRGPLEAAMGLEAVYFVGALILLTALIYGTLTWRYRNRAADRMAEQIVRERYRHDQT